MANVSVSNTTGLYIGSGAASVLNNAQQLLGLLSNNGGVVFSLDPTTSNTKVQGNAQAAGGNYGNSNVAAFLPTYTGAMTSMTGAVTTTANVTGAFILGNGSQLTGLGATYSNTNVAAFLPTYTGAISSMTGNLTTTANVQGSFILGNGSQLTGLPATYSNTNVAAFLPTYTGAISSMTGNLTTSANVQGAFLLGNGSQLTGITTNYSNTNVAAFLPTYTGAISSMTGNLTTTANVQGAFILGNGSQLTGIVGSTYSNTNVAAFLPTYTGAMTSMTGNVTTTANIQGGNIVTSGASGNIAGANFISANFFVGNGSLLTGIAAGSTYGNTNVAAFLPTYTGALTSMTGNVITTANVQGAFILGNGSALTGITTNYSNANVAAFLPTYTGAITSMTGNVTTTANVQAGNIVTSGSSGNIAGANYISANFFVGNGSLLTGISGGSSYGDSNVALFLPNYTGAISSLTGNVTTTANVQGAFILGNGSALTGIVTNYSNTNVAAFLPTYTGAITSMTGNVTTTANVQGAFILGNGSQLTGVTATLANVAYELQAQSPTPAGNITFDGGGNMNLRTTAAGGGNATVNIYSGITVIGSNCVARFDGGATAANLTVGFISSNANITTSANAQAAFFIGNGSQLTGISGGSSYGDSNVALFLPNYTGAISSMTGNLTTTANAQAAFFIGNGSQLTGISGGGTPGGASTYIQFNNAGSFDGSANLIYQPADGNITLGNLVFNKNYNRILQTNAFDTTVQSATQNATGQFIIGDGWNGNVTSPSFNTNQTIDGAFVLVNKSFTKTDNGRRASGFGVQTFVNVTANMTNGGTRITGLAVMPRIGGNTTQTALNSTAVAGINTLLTVGGGTSTFASLGNANLRIATGTISSVEPLAGSFIGNAYGYIAGVQGTAAGQFLTRAIGYTMQSQGTSNATPSFYGYHMPNATSYGGININNSMRASAEYYFLYNEDDVAQVRLGSLRRYTEYRANITSSSGNLTIDKNTAQVQYLTPTEAVTNVSFTNFVTNANDGTNNDTQTDTVTLIVQQGATPYSITMPSGSEYKYAGNVRTVGNTANSVTMISTTGTKNVSGDTDLYLITISPEFV